MLNRKNKEPITIKERYYKFVLDEDLTDYFSFRDKVQYKYMEIDAKQIRYLEAGHGEVILMLPGSTGKGISFYEYIRELSRDYRVIAIDYPIADSLSDMTEAVKKFIEKISDEGEMPIIIATSFGTVLVQSLLKEAPKLFKAIFFIHGVSKDEFISKKLVKINRKAIKSFLKEIKFLNFDSFQKSFAKRLRNNFNLYSENTSLKLFWEGFYEEMLYSTTKEEMISNYTFMKDFWDNYIYSRLDFDAVACPVFIIEAFKDMDAELPEKMALCSLFSNHEMIILRGDANMSLIKNKDEIINVIKEKLRKE